MSNRILICDDDEGIRESLKLILLKDYDLIFAEDGIQCLDELQKQKSAEGYIVKPFRREGVLKTVKSVI